MVDVRVADTADERADALAVRHEVFVEEQGVDPDLEVDEHDADAVHVVAYDGDDPVGAARLRELGGEDEREDAGETAEGESRVGKVERVAVLQSRREEGIGSEIMAAVEAEAASQGLETVKLHSQTHAADFYETLAYERSSDVFEEAGIPHVEMRKSVE